MRKSLLAGAAIVGMSFGMFGVANAAEMLPPSPTQGKLVTTLSGGNISAFDNNSSGPSESKGPIANPTPGTMVIRLNARVDTDITFAWSSLDSFGGNKLYPYRFLQYMRLFPAMDAMAANGLRYGGAVELRENGGSFPGTTGAAGGTAFSTTQTVFVRREFVYLAGDQWGYVRIGEADGLIGVYDGGGKTSGVFLSPSGTIVGGNLQSGFPGNTWMAPYFAAQSGNEYANVKVVYLSPQFAGFDVGLQYAPNGFNGYGGSCSSAESGVGCYNLSSTTSSTLVPGSRMKDQYAVGVRYDGAFSGAKVLAYGVYMGSGHVNYNGAPIAGVAGSTYTGQFDGLSLGMFGANVEYAGLSVFGNVMVGDYNGVLALNPKGAHNAIGWGAGVKYATGPYTMGFVYSQFDSQGDVALTGVTQRHANVFYAAATYSLAPGLTMYADYAYGTQHQGDFNFMTGAHDSAYNNIHSQGFLIGTNLAW